MGKKTNKMRIKIDITKLRNELHFDVQKSTRAQVFRDCTKYSHTRKHRNKNDH
jgi:hypothetical protein